MQRWRLWCCATLWLFLGVWPAWARLPNESAYSTLAAAINADPALTTLVAERRDQEIADYMNTAAPGPYWVWRTSVPASDYTGANGIVWTEVGALTAGQARIFEWLTGGLIRTVNASDVNVRQGIADAFGAGTTTRANLLALARRAATRAEVLFVVNGAGTTGNPGTMGWEGLLTAEDVGHALRGIPLS